MTESVANGNSTMLNPEMRSVDYPHVKRVGKRGTYVITFYQKVFLSTRHRSATPFFPFRSLGEATPTHATAILHYRPRCPWPIYLDVVMASLDSPFASPRTCTPSHCGEHDDQQ